MARFLSFFGLGVVKRLSETSHPFLYFSFLIDWWCAFVIGEIINALKTMRMVLMAPFQLIITTTGVGRLFIFSAFFVGLIVSLAALCYKLIELFSDWLSGSFFDQTPSSWIQFIGYVLNFDLFYKIFVFYYSVFCLFVVSFIVTSILEIASSVVPEAIQIFRDLLKTLTGDD